VARPSSRHPTELELEILKVLWRDGPVAVRHVRDSLSGFRDLAYTSVTTIMNIMVKKGYLKRKKQGGRYIYSARVMERSIRRRMLKDLVERVFHGSPVAAMVNLLDAGEVDESELKELREMINRRMREEGSQ